MQRRSVRVLLKLNTYTIPTFLMQWDLLVGFQLENLLSIHCYVLHLELYIYANIDISAISSVNTLQRHFLTSTNIFYFMMSLNNKNNNKVEFYSCERMCAHGWRINIDNWGEWIVMVHSFMDEQQNCVYVACFYW